MKFSEMPYTRPDLEKIQKDSAAILERITNARSAQEQIDAYLAYEEMSKEVGTNCSIAYVRHTIDTRDSFYDQEALFWLSRVIHRESGNQPMEGRMAVGNVVLNRVSDPVFPDTVEGVLAQKNQFSTYKSGVLAATEPSENSTIAAKLVMDGGVVEETQGALFFDSGVNSWAARNKRHIATIGGHKFYG